MHVQSLEKKRGENNGALSDVKRARVVTISEMDENQKFNEGALRSIISGEPQFLKQMYQKEVSTPIYLKLLFFVNWMPKWNDPNALCTRRRNITMQMPRIFIDKTSPEGKIQLEKHKNAGIHPSLIAEIDRNMKHAIKKHKKAFIRFWVLGAIEYYKQGKFDIPSYFKELMEQLKIDPVEVVHQYIHKHLKIQKGARLLPATIFKHFNDDLKLGIGTPISNQEAFNKAFNKAICEKGTEWEPQKGPPATGLEYKRALEGSDAKNPEHADSAKQGANAMCWINVTFKDPNKAKWNRGKFD